MEKSVDDYLSEGCGRCPLGGTPGCKVHLWQPELKKLRSLLLECGLQEEVKWAVPCYTYPMGAAPSGGGSRKTQNSNIAILAAFKEYCALSFFKGALLSDTHGILEKPGEHTQAARLLAFTDVKKIASMEAVIKAYIYEAIEVERAGMKVDFKEKTALVIPEELQQKWKEMPRLKDAFEALTPGRQRSHILFISAPKQSKTRISRVEKCIDLILQGKGLNEG